MIKRTISNTRIKRLPDHEQEVLEDPFYDPMIEALWSGNYGPWIVSVMQNMPLNATSLDLKWSVSEDRDF